MKKQLQNNRFYRGYYLYVKDRGQLSDNDALNLLGIFNIQLSVEDNQKDFFDYSSPKVYITETGDWKHIIDNYGYSVFNHLDKTNDSESKKNILNLVKNYELFEAFISDIDDCYYYKYYKQGILCRHYSIEPVGNSCWKNYIATDIGKAKIEEKEILKKNNQDDKIFEIAGTYGVEIFHAIKNIRCYRFGKWNQLA